MAYTARGRRPTAPLSAHDSAMQLDALKAHFFVDSTRQSRASHFRTWTSFHFRWFGEGQVLPLTVDSMTAVAAQFKAQGYRSFPNYLDTLVDLHKLEHPWTYELDRTRKLCAASTQRGIGPTRQALEIPIDEVNLLRRLWHMAQFAPRSGRCYATSTLSGVRNLLAPSHPLCL